MPDAVFLCRVSTNHNVYQPKLEHIREKGRVLVTVTQLLSWARSRPIVLWANWINSALYSLFVTSCSWSVFPLWYWRRCEQCGAQAGGTSLCSTSGTAHSGHRSGDVAKDSVFAGSDLSAQVHVFSNAVVTELPPGTHTVDLSTCSMLFRWQRPSLASESGLNHPTTTMLAPILSRKRSHLNFPLNCTFYAPASRAIGPSLTNTFKFPLS